MSDDKHCPTCTCNQDVHLPKSNLDDYSIKRDFYQPIDALDVKKTSMTWETFVKCDSKYGTKLRFYRWKKEKNAAEWKVSLAAFDVDSWDIDKIKQFLAKK